LVSQILALASRRSAEPPLAQGAIRRNRSNRLKTGPGDECAGPAWGGLTRMGCAYPHLRGGCKNT